MHVVCESPPHKLRDSWKSTYHIWISPLKWLLHMTSCLQCLILICDRPAWRRGPALFITLSSGTEVLPPPPSPGRVLTGSPGAYPWALLRPVAASLRGAAAGRIGPSWVGSRAAPLPPPPPCSPPPVRTVLVYSHNLLLLALAEPIIKLP